MAKNKKQLTKKLELIQVGIHLINPSDVASITKIRKGLYIVRQLSNPNPQYPIWVATKDIGGLLEHFDIIDSGVKVIEDGT